MEERKLDTDELTDLYMGILESWYNVEDDLKGEIKEHLLKDGVKTLGLKVIEGYMGKSEIRLRMDVTFGF